MTAMVDDLGERGDVAAASLILEAHRQCRDCAAGQCETGAQADELLAAHRQARAAYLASAGRA